MNRRESDPSAGSPMSEMGILLERRVDGLLMDFPGRRLEILEAGSP